MWEYVNVIFSVSAMMQCPCDHFWSIGAHLSSTAIPSHTGSQMLPWDYLF